MPFHNIKGILFDMDGTLIDSEPYTEKSVLQLLHRHDISAKDLDCTQYYGINWETIAIDLHQRFLQLSSVDIAAWLEEYFDHCMKVNTPPFISGAKEVLEVCSSLFSTALVTSSNKGSVELFSERFSRIPFDICISADDYNHSKPNPECYLLAAQKLGLLPEECLVFEDSIPGLTAAKNAEMKTIGITCRSADPKSAMKIADLTITTYDELPPDFFGKLAKEQTST